MSEFAEKRILVTGGLTGIGEAIARAFREAGATVHAAGLPELDITSAASVEKLMSEVPALDVLVNCAGAIQRDAEFRMDVFEHIIDVNLNGTMRLCVAARPKLAASSGAIVNLGSMLTFFGGPRVPAYTASKGGVAQLTRALAVAWAKENIRVNAVAPGWIRTPLTQPLQDDPERSASILARVPMTRWGTPEDVAGPVLFLCSHAARFITGAILPVDGGYSAA